MLFALRTAEHNPEESNFEDPLHKKIVCLINSCESDL